MLYLSWVISATIIHLKIVKQLSKVSHVRLKLSDFVLLWGLSSDDLIKLSDAYIKVPIWVSNRAVVAEPGIPPSFDFRIER